MTERSTSERALSALTAIGMDEAPITTLEREDALFVLTGQTLVYQDGGGTRRVTLRDLTRIHSDEQGTLRVETPAGTALTASLLGFDIAGVQAFFAQVRDTTARAKELPVTPLPAPGGLKTFGTAPARPEAAPPTTLTPPARPEPRAQPAAQVGTAVTAPTPGTRPPADAEPMPHPPSRATPEPEPAAPPQPLPASRNADPPAGAAAAFPPPRPATAGGPLPHPSSLPSSGAGVTEAPAGTAPPGAAQSSAAQTGASATPSGSTPPRPAAPPATSPTPAPSKPAAADAPEAAPARPVVISSSAFTPTPARGAAQPADVPKPPTPARAANVRTAADPAPAPVAPATPPAEAAVTAPARELDGLHRTLSRQADAVDSLVGRLRFLGGVLFAAALLLALTQFTGGARLDALWTLLSGGVGTIALLALAELARLLALLGRSVSRGGPDAR